MTLPVYIGDVRAALDFFPDNHFHCVVTSPPYWGLRSYLPGDHPDKSSELGAEPTLQEYVDNMVRVFTAVRRVLRPDGVLWLNLGDSYARNNTKRVNNTEHQDRGWKANQEMAAAPLAADSGLKPKDLCLVPYRVALALQADGWYVRSNVVWAKGLSFCENYSGSVMPESIRDRPTNAHEALFLLTKSPRYWYDPDAVREVATWGNIPNRTVLDVKGRPPERTGMPTHNGLRASQAEGRNLRNVWAITPKPYKGAHYAVFPEELVAPCIKAGCPPHVCGACGAPHERIVTRTNVPASTARRAHLAAMSADAGIRLSQKGGTRASTLGAGRGGDAPLPTRTTTGWKPTCDCPPDTPTVPGTVLDPFMGSGTTAAVAERLGRQWVGIDLDGRNLALIEERVAKARAIRETQSRPCTHCGAPEGAPCATSTGKTLPNGKEHKARRAPTDPPTPTTSPQGLPGDTPHAAQH